MASGQWRVSSIGSGFAYLGRSWLPFSCLVIPVVSAVARLTQVTAVAAHQSVNAAAAGEAATAAEAAAAGEAATAAEAAAAGEQAAAEALHAPI